MDDLKLLKEISEVNGISGFEKNVAKLVKKEISDSVDEINFDNLGSLIAYKRTNKDNVPLVMLSAHMDEVGFLVKSIEESGLIRITNIGGWYNHIIPNQSYVITTKQGQR